MPQVRGRRARKVWRLVQLLLVIPLPIIGPITVPAGGSPVPPTTSTSTTPTTTTTTATTPAPPYPIPQAGANPFQGRGLWIWELSRTDGGDLTQLIGDAHAYGLTTVFIKSSDGSQAWPQFNASLVQALHQNGLKVCAWQYVYGTYPAAEAQVGAAAVSDGADCLAIDAEGEYDGRYAQAQQYLTRLRKLIGASFPVGLAGLPYIDYHTRFPYSVFLGPGGAQYDLPQMYWHDIGTSVDAVYAHTYAYNLIFGRAIYPLGQLTANPRPADIVRFRQLSAAYGAGGVSWWDWQEAGNRQLAAMSSSIGVLAGYKPAATVITLKRGAKGDLVIWAQEHLVSTGRHVPIDGSFGPLTQQAVSGFQTEKGLTASGKVDQATWIALLRYKAAYVHWTIPKPKKKPAKKKPKSTPAPPKTTTISVPASPGSGGSAP
jgi:hypothetical protein